MAKTPVGAYVPTDDELDELVNAEIADMGQTPTPDPKAPPAAAASGEEDDELDEEDDLGEAGADDDEQDEVETAPPATPAPAAPAPAPGAPAAAPAPAAPAAIPGAKPFQFNATGGVHVLAGAEELPDGRVVIAPAALPEVKRILASEREYARQVPALKRQLAAKDTERTQAVEEATAVATAMQDYIAKLLKMTPDERWAAIQELEDEMPRLQLEVKEAALSRKEKALAEREKGPQPTPEEQRDQVSQVLVSNLKDTYARLKDSPEVKALGADAVNKVFKRFADQPGQMFRKAPADIQGTDIKKGDWYYDDSALLEALQFAVELRGGVAAPAPTGAAARNAAANADLAPNAIPPVVGGGTVTGEPQRRRLKKMDKRTFNKKFLAGELDEPDPT